MDIPPITSYPMPAAADLVRSVAPWRPDAGRAALLIHDLQNHFVDFFPAGQAPVTTLLANIARLRTAADALGVPVFYSAQPGGMSEQERGLLRDFWGPGMTGDPDRRAIVAPLTPRPGDTVVTKWRYSAFHATTLGADLAAYGRDQLIVCGVYAHVGCLMTACDAFSHDIEAFLVTDAVADFSAEHHRDALTYAAQRCAVILDTDRVLRSLTTAPLTRRRSAPARRGASRPVRPAS